MNKLKRRIFSTCLRILLGSIVGLLCGYILNKHHKTISIHHNFLNRSNPEYQQGSEEGPYYESDNQLHSYNFKKPTKFPRNRQIFIGVMTTRQFLATRARAAYDTWVSDVPGRVTFFSAENSSDAGQLAGLPSQSVVSLTGVDDTYPPQKKSFLLLKYMHDVHLNDYEWFMRADDDLYVRPKRLVRFLRSINHSKPLYIGQSGRGNRVSNLNLLLLYNIYILYSKSLNTILGYI